MAGSSDAPINQPTIHEQVIERAAQKVLAEIKGRNESVKPPWNERDYLDDRARNLRERRRLKVGWGLGGLGAAEIIDIVTTLIQLFG